MMVEQRIGPMLHAGLFDFDRAGLWIERFRVSGRSHS